MGSNLAGVSVFSNLTLTRADETLQPSFGIYVSNGFLFCLAEARLLLAFGCFGTEALFFFLTYYFLLFSYIYLFFLMGSKGDVKQSILSACFLLGMGSNLAGVSVFSNLTLTRL